MSVVGLLRRASVTPGVSDFASAGSIGSSSREEVPDCWPRPNLSRESFPANCISYRKEKNKSDPLFLSNGRFKK